MRKKNVPIQALIVFALTLVLSAPQNVSAGQRQDKTQHTLESPQNRDTRQAVTLADEVRHQLVTLPYYSVFDWLEANVKPDGAVTLMGQVTRPTLKSDAESKIKNLESATRLVNDIEVLPLSNVDDELRAALYRTIYRSDSPLFKYALQSVGPIHIIVKNGRVTLKGFVSTQADSQLAYMAAAGIPGVFDLKNELQLEQAITTNAPHGIG